MVRDLGLPLLLLAHLSLALGDTVAATAVAVTPTINELGCLVGEVPFILE